MPVTYAQTQQGPGGAVSFVLRVPRAWADPAWAARMMQTQAEAITQRTAQRLTRRAKAAYRAFPRIAAGFQQLSSTGPTVVAGLTNTNPIFPYREFDTRAHLIAARTAPWLHFKGSRGWARVQEVQHPGTQGLYAIAPLFAEEETQWQADLAAALAEVLTA